MGRAICLNKLAYLEPEEAMEVNPLGISLERSSILGWNEELTTARLSEALLCCKSSAAIFEFFFSVPGGEPMGSTQFLHPIHLHMAEHAIFAWSNTIHHRGLKRVPH